MVEMITKLYMKGKELIFEMGEDFLPFMTINLKYQITDTDEVAILLGTYLKGLKEDRLGDKTLSKSGYEQFLVHLNYELEE